MAAVEITQESLEIALMARTGFVVCFLELGIFDVLLAVLAPVTRL